MVFEERFPEVSGPAGPGVCRGRYILYIDYTAAQRARVHYQPGSASNSIAMVRDKKIQNALKRSEVHRKTKREKEQVKLKRRMEVSRVWCFASAQ